MLSIAFRGARAVMFCDVVVESCMFIHSQVRNCRCNAIRSNIWPLINKRSMHAVEVGQATVYHIFAALNGSTDQCSPRSQQEACSWSTQHWLQVRASSLLQSSRSYGSKQFTTGGPHVDMALSRGCSSHQATESTCLVVPCCG